MQNHHRRIILARAPISAAKTFLYARRTLIVARAFESTWYAAVTEFANSNVQKDAEQDAQENIRASQRQGINTTRAAAIQGTMPGAQVLVEALGNSKLHVPTALLKST